MKQEKIQRSDKKFWVNAKVIENLEQIKKSNTDICKYE